MTPAQYNRLRLASNAWRLPFRGRGGVLLYHRIAELDHDPWSLAIKPGDFADHLAILERKCVCLTLSELLERRTAGTLPANAVALTFDDGYADNLEAALPLLERHGIPATIFVLSGFVGGDVETWWDRLEQIVFKAAALPDEIELTVGQSRLVWSARAWAPATACAPCCTTRPTPPWPWWTRPSVRRRWPGWRGSWATSPRPAPRIAR